MKKLLVYDSSGTINDVLPERYLAFALAYNRINPKNELFVITGKMESELSTITQSDYINSGVYQRYTKLNPFVQTGKDGFVLFEAINHSRDHEIESSEDFDLFRKTFDGSELEAYVNQVKIARNYMKDNERELWLSLQPHFEGVPQLIRQMDKTGHYESQYVLTAKDAQTVFSLIQAYGISDIIPEDNVIETSKGKQKALEELADSKGKDISQIVFIEDSYPNILPCHEAGVSPILVSWGYSTEQMQDDARSIGIPVVSNSIELQNLLIELHKS